MGKLLTSLSPLVLFPSLLLAIPAERVLEERGIELERVAVEVVGGVEVGAEEVAGKVAELAEAEPAKGGDAESKAAIVSDPGAAILKDLDFDPSAKKFAEKHGALFLDAAGLEKVRKQIADLDAEDFIARNDASKGLAMVEAPVEHLLGAARKEAGIEMSRRIQSILNVRIEQRRLDALYHVAGKIAADETPGYVERLLVMAATFDTSSHWDLLRMFEMAVAKSARDQDRALLDAAHGGESVAAREVAAFALGYRFSDKSKGSDAAVDEADQLKLARARGMAAAADKAAGDTLLALLESEDTRVRHEAGLLLRGIYGKDFGFAAYDSKARRTEAIGRWGNALSGGAADKDVQSVVLGIGARGEFRVLVGKTPGKDGSVVAWTTSGKSAGTHPLSSAMGGINPNRITFDDSAGLVVASGGRADDGRVAIFSADGAELWNISGVPAGGGSAAVAGGKLLVAIGDEVEELDVSGDRVSRWKLSSEIASFGRLREGRYLCAHPEEGMVAEYGAGGELLWSEKGFNHPSRVERLPNGNLLVVASTKSEDENGDNNNNNGEAQVELIETTPDAKAVLTRIQPKGVASITSAARLPNGNTLIGTEKGLAEYTPEGYAIKVWLKTAISSLHVR